MTIGSHGKTVEIVSESLSLRKMAEDMRGTNLLYRFISGFEISPQGKSIVKLQVEDSHRQAANISAFNSFISGKYGESLNATDVIVVAEYMLERQRQEDGIYTIHSSCVCKNGQAILLIGNLTGCGKTSTAIYLAQKFGYSVFSDEKTLIDLENMTVVGQIKKIFVEPKTFAALPESFRKTVRKEESIRKLPPQKIAFMVTPIVAQKTTKTSINKYSSDQLRWTLYEEVSKDIRLINGAIFNFSFPLNSLDSFKIAKRRLVAANKASSLLKCYLVQGQLGKAAWEINRLFEKEIFQKRTVRRE